MRALRRRRRVKKQRCRPVLIIKRIFILALLIFTAGFIYFEIQVKPMIIGLTEIKAQFLATEAINTAVNNKLKTQSMDYEDLVSIKCSSDNKIEGITSNTLNMNKIKAEYSLEAQKQIDKLQHKEISLYYGDLSGIELLKGRGPQVHIYLNFSSSIETEIKSSFQSAGVNQTQHIIELIIRAEIYLTSDEYIPNVEVVTNVPIAQTIIVGQTPSLYTGNLIS
ncbi:MAG: sporulation protein YunB [Acutalibacteraceae bacterium]